MGFTRLGGPWTCWVGLGDPPPVGGVGTPWIPLLPDRLRVRGRERGSEGSHEPVEAGTPGGRAAQIGPWLANCSELVKSDDLRWEGFSLNLNHDNIFLFPDKAATDLTFSWHLIKFPLRGKGEPH